ncbi:MAG TPA: hypothetical protein VF945_03080 [Polyangia bacterium]
MLKAAALAVLLVAAAPAFAQEGPRTDVTTVKRLVAQAASLCKREPADLALALARVNLSGELEQALRARPAAGLKVAPR